MKSGFRGVPRPLLPAMLPVVDQSAGPADQAEDQPSSSEPLPSTSRPTPVVEPTPELEAPQSQYPSHPHVPEARSLTAEDLLHMVPTLITKVDSLETELKQTKQTMGKAIVKLVKKIPLVSFVTPTKPSGEDQEEEISPTTLEAVKTLSKVASQRSKSVDKETQAPKELKKQFKQEEASLAEVIRLQNLEEEQTVKQVHLDALLAKRLAEEEELTEQQKLRKAQVQFEAQHYTEEDGA
ncbi:hypothetical protein Tco_1185059 [Tanacetum coccineum]